jgi:hypothetical protein
VVTTEGTVPFRGYRTWYRVAGELPPAADKPPPAGPSRRAGFPPRLPGGPAQLADDGRAVVFYDQLGCGTRCRATNEGELMTTQTRAVARLAADASAHVALPTPAASSS